LELGTFVGYSALRLARACMRARGRGRSGPWLVVSVEVSPLEACLARHFVDLARASALAEIWVARSGDVLPRLVEEFSERAVGLQFLDHRGKVFHEDLEQAEHMDLLAAGSRVLADNVVSPGSPLLLWHIFRSSKWAATAWSLCEFLEPDHEDWMVAGRLLHGPGIHVAPPAPERLWALAWEAEHLRRRSEGFRPAEPPVQATDRIALATRVADAYRALGIEAVPWRGPARPRLAAAEASGRGGRGDGA